MGEASPALVNTGRNCLHPGSRGADQADRPAAYSVRESEAHPIDDGGSAIRPHEQQALRGCGPFQFDFLFQRNIVAVQKDIASEIQCLPGHCARVAARHRNQDPFSLRQHLGRGLQAAWAIMTRLNRPPSGEQLIDLSKGRIG